MAERGVTLVIGPMFSGKTSEIIKIINSLTDTEYKILVINYYGDDRKKEEGCVLSTHNMKILDSMSVSLKLTTQIAVKKLFDIKSIHSFNMVVIDEAQFFPDLYDFVVLWQNDVEFVISGLDTDYRKESFGDIPKIKTISHRVIQLKGVCSGKEGKCKKLATHTRRKIKKCSLELVGGSEIYEPVCEDCHTIV
jgi:thymidine kinase